MPELMVTGRPGLGIYCPAYPNEDATRRMYENVMESAASAVWQSAFLTMKARFAEAHERLRSTGTLGPNWDTYGGEPPNETARTLARRVLGSLEVGSLPPTRVMPSVEGGIGFSFVEQDNRADIEIYNTGEIVAATYSAQKSPEIWVLDGTEHSLTKTVHRIRVHLAA